MLVAAAADALAEDLAHAAQDDPDLVTAKLHFHRHAGFVRVAFRLAFWELRHAPTAEAALLDCANRGGDADTNAAITGALLGALHGEAAIPAAWRTAVADASKPGPRPRPSDAYLATRLFRVLDVPPPV